MASSPAIFNLLNKEILFDNATFEYEKLCLYLKLCMDKLFSLPVGIEATFTAWLRMLVVVAAVVVAQLLCPKFAIYD